MLVKYHSLTHSLIRSSDLVVHLNTDVVEHINYILIIVFSVSFFFLKDIRNSVEALCKVPSLVKTLELLESVPDLNKNLGPLQFIVLEISLNLFDYSLLVLV